MGLRAPYPKTDTHPSCPEVLGGGGGEEVLQDTPDSTIFPT